MKLNFKEKAGLHNVYVWNLYMCSPVPSIFFPSQFRPNYLSFGLVQFRLSLRNFWLTKSLDQVIFRQISFASMHISVMAWEWGGPLLVRTLSRLVYENNAFKTLLINLTKMIRRLPHVHGFIPWHLCLVFLEHWLFIIRMLMVSKIITILWFSVP